jgi:hypothetical protein
MGHHVTQMPGVTIFARHMVRVDGVQLRAAPRVLEVGSDYCIAHCGGRRCTTEGCTKSAQGTTEHCSAHGGGRRCKAESCTKGALGMTEYCRAHGDKTVLVCVLLAAAPTAPEAAVKHGRHTGLGNGVKMLVVH